MMCSLFSKSEETSPEEAEGDNNIYVIDNINMSCIKIFELMSTNIYIYIYISDKYMHL